MLIDLNRNGGELMVTLEGELDAISAQELEGRLRTALDGDVTDLIFELGKLEYIASGGLRVLLAAQKVMNRQGNMVVRHLTEEVREVFDITGFMDLTTVED